VLAFEPNWLQAIAAFIPLTYGIHAMQMALFYSSADLLGRDILVLGLSALATLLLAPLPCGRDWQVKGLPKISNPAIIVPV